MRAPITRMPRIAVTRAIPRRGAIVIRMRVLLRGLIAVAEPDGERRGVALEFIGAEWCVRLATHDHADTGDIEHARRGRVELGPRRVEIAEHEPTRRTPRERTIRPAHRLVRRAFRGPPGQAIRGAEIPEAIRR